MNITISGLILTTIGLLFVYFLKKNNENRKENLNIVKEGDRLHLFLSDDHFLSIRLEDDGSITDDVTKNISNKIENIRESIRRVSFVNFKSEMLKKRLNRILEAQKA
jgi:hypothetical protein